MPVPDWLSDNQRWEAYLDGLRSVERWAAYPQEFFSRLRGMSRRARLVAWCIFEQGSVSTQSLKDAGYEHPPRARKDLTDHGVRVETARAKHPETGRPMGLYSFADPGQVLAADQSGRSAVPKKLSDAVLARDGHRCSLCSGRFGRQDLQADHRVPYAIGGDAQGQAPDASDLMAVCRSCNRAKSWSCEHCPNWSDQDRATCATCYWAAPGSYTHIALQDVRRADIVWQGNEVAVFDLVRALSAQASTPLPDYVKAVLADHVRGRRVEASGPEGR